MRGKLLLLSLLLAISIAGARAAQSGFTIQSFANGEPSEPAMLDPSVPGGLRIQQFNNVDSSGTAKLDQTVNAVAPAPEPQTIAMMILGSGCLGALTLLRRRRRG